MEADTISKHGRSSTSHKSRGNFLIAIVLFSVLGLSCSKTVPFTVTPSNADIYNRNGTKVGTGSTNVFFSWNEGKSTCRSFRLEAPTYRTQTVRVCKSQNSATYTMARKVDTRVNVSVTPSNAEILYSNGNRVGIGSGTLIFDEDLSPTAFFDLTLSAPNHYSQTVRVRKSDNSPRNFTLQRMPIKTVVVIPSNAEIAVNNEVVGRGSYDVSFENRDRVLLTFSAVGYETASFTLLRSHTQQTITYELEVDEAYANSIGGEAATQYANRWVPITVRQGLSEDEVWLRMMAIVREHFEQIEKTDKSSGWIKTFPTITPYRASDVRTTLEITPSYSTGVLQYRVRLSFEKRPKGSGDEGWARYDRLLNIYRDVIPNLINSIGGGM